MPNTALCTPTEAPPAAPVAAGAQAPRPEPSVADTARLLAQHFPALFGAGVIKPIKLRIQVDIHQRAPGVFTKKALSIFLQRHTTGTAYLRALVAEGAKRIDLDGQPVGEISAEHRDAAGVELERRRAIVEARKLAEREAARASRDDARALRAPRPPLPSQPVEASQSASKAPGERPATRGARPVRPGTSDRPDHSPTSSRPGNTGSDASRRPRKPRPPERKHVLPREHEPGNAPALQLTSEEMAEAKARHQRALLLRSFEQSPLSKANFGALKGLSEGALDALLALARQELGSR
jgi:ProP effector